MNEENIKKEDLDAIAQMVFRFSFVLYNKDKFNKVKIAFNERIEIMYFLLSQIDRIIFSKNEKERDNFFDQILYKTFQYYYYYLCKILNSEIKLDIFSDKHISEYNQRTDIYSKCISFMSEGGPTCGTELFALGYFIKRARGETKIPIENLLNILNGSQKLDRENNDAFLDFAESLDLTIQMTTSVSEIKNLLINV